MTACAASMSLAQTTIETPSNISVRLGWAYPLDSDTRAITGNLLGVGFDYFLNRTLIPGANGETYISADWLGRSASGSKGNMFPLMLNQRWYSAPSMVGGADGNRTYYFVGAGAYVMDVTNTKTVFGARVGLGMELGEKLFAEANLSYTEAANFRRGSNIAIYIGYRF